MKGAGLRTSPNMTDHVRSRLWFARVAVWSALSIAVLALGIVFVRADGFPSRPVRIIVPLNPGAGVDIVARMVANGLSEQTGKSVVVENRSGGATLVGAEVVAQSEPDGHTLLFTPDDTFTILPHLSKSLAFDPNKELIPITGIAKIINIMFVNSTIPVKTLPELIDYARAHPGALSYGTNGQGNLLKSKPQVFVFPFQAFDIFLILESQLDRLVKLDFCGVLVVREHWPCFFDH